MNASAAKRRTFIAIDLPASTQIILRAYQQRLQDRLAREVIGDDETGRQLKLTSFFRWSAIKKSHLTLRFLGQTTDHQRAVIATQLSDLASAWSPFTLRIHGLGGFPTQSRPRVLWAGVADANAVLRPLQEEVETCAVGAGFRAEKKPFRPHLTLARARRSATNSILQVAGTALTDLAELSVADLSVANGAEAFSVTRLIHYQSELQPSGAVYTPLAMFPLSA